MLVVASLTALGVWKYAPGTELDRLAFSAVAGGSANGPLFISGKGGRTDPWALRTFTTTPRTGKREAPVIVSIGDDPDRFFQSSPPAPIDLAVIFSNFHRLGARKAASAAALAWEKPDPIGLAALEKALDRFDSLVLTAPLSRGVVPTPMPPAFRRTSVAISSIHGDATQLPLVNRLPIPEIILGGDETIAGFSFLESELDNGDIPLMARWDERVVFAFPLITMLQRLDLPLAGVEVRLGEYMKLGPAGPLVPIDHFGRLAMEPKEISPYAEIPADALIDGGDDLFPKQAPDPVILRDDQSATDTRTRAFSQGLAGVIAGIASNGGLSEAHEFRRLPENGEAGILAVLVAAMALLAGMSRFVRNIGTLVMLGVGLAAQWIAFSAGSIWLPGVAMAATVAVAGAFGFLLRDRVSVGKEQAAPSPAPAGPQSVHARESVPETPATAPVLPAVAEPPSTLAAPAPESESNPWWTVHDDDTSPAVSDHSEMTPELPSGETHQEKAEPGIESPRHPSRKKRKRR